MGLVEVTKYRGKVPESQIFGWSPLPHGYKQRHVTLHERARALDPLIREPATWCSTLRPLQIEKTPMAISSQLSRRPNVLAYFKKFLTMSSVTKKRVLHTARDAKTHRVKRESEDARPHPWYPPSCAFASAFAAPAHKTKQRSWRNRHEIKPTRSF